MLVLMIGAVGLAMCLVHMRSTAYGGEPFPKLRSGGARRGALHIVAAFDDLEGPCERSR
jgi:hypothetical protein